MGLNSNTVREALADVVAALIVAAAILSHLLNNPDPFLDSVGLIALAFLGLSGAAAKTANGQAAVVNANALGIAALATNPTAAAEILNRSAAIAEAIHAPSAIVPATLPGPVPLPAPVAVAVLAGPDPMRGGE